MTLFRSDISTFLLIDNGLLTAADGITIAADEHSRWLACVYENSAATVSPHVIDIHAANEAGQMDRVMALVNATSARLHVSVIDVSLSLAELVSHFRRFIMVRCADDKIVTLRFADSAVLPQLAVAFTSEQWAALVGPIIRWRVHGYDGKLLALPGADTAVIPEATPLLLSPEQLSTLDRAMLPNRVLANVRSIRHGADLPGSAADQHAWASESVRLWRDAGSAHVIVLRWLTTAALDTQGAVLEPARASSLLKQSDLTTIHSGLLELVIAHRVRLNRTGEYP